MIAAIGCVLTAGLTAGCGSDSGTLELPPGTNPPGGVPQARVRIINAVPDGPRLDFVVNNQEVFDDLVYRTATNYQDFSLAGPVNLRLNVADTSTNLVNITPVLNNNGSYTLVAVGAGNSVQNLLLTDNNAVASGDNVRVRVVHASPRVGNVDVYVTRPDVDLNGTAPTLSNIGFQTVSDYLTLPSGDWRVRVTAPGSKAAVADSGTLNWEDGTVRTAFAVGDPAGDEDEDPEVLVTDDRAALGLED